jgi:hypothetical protein
MAVLLLPGCGADTTTATPAASATSAAAAPTSAKAACTVKIDPQYLPGSDYRSEFQDMCKLVEFDRQLKAAGVTYPSSVQESFRFESATSVCYALKDGESYSKILDYAGSSNPVAFVRIDANIFCPDWGSTLPK